MRKKMQRWELAWRVQGTERRPMRLDNRGCPALPAALFDHGGEPRGSYRGPRGFAFTLAFTPATLPVPSAMLPAPPSQVRQSYHPDCEAAVNSHFNLEFHAASVCLAAAVYLYRYDVALKHFSWFFVRRSLEHSGWARRLMRLQNQRGSRIRFQDIGRPVSIEWKSGLKAMKCTLFLEKFVNRSLRHLHQLAIDKSDPHLHRFLATHYSSQQVAFISELEGHVTTLSMMGAPDVDLAGSLFEKLTLGDSDKKN
ncbi:ferritin heavy chain-like [Lagenorhynchus albirostris]|uniref:ferritin heavy chain-like n=1 Tax=Lagenorhynchus albirostris TaxID=27610 RepID=UPI0028F04617|nr:ferritin heavy chain-like [Lagenorhynchus albirostris]